MDQITLLSVPKIDIRYINHHNLSQIAPSESSSIQTARQSFIRLNTEVPSPSLVIKNYPITNVHYQKSCKEDTFNLMDPKRSKRQLATAAAIRQVTENFDQHNETMIAQFKTSQILEVKRSRAERCKLGIAMVNGQSSGEQATGRNITFNKSKITFTHEADVDYYSQSGMNTTLLKMSKQIRDKKRKNLLQATMNISTNLDPKGLSPPPTQRKPTHQPSQSYDLPKILSEEAAYSTMSSRVQYFNIMKQTLARAPPPLIMTTKLDCLDENALEKSRKYYSQFRDTATTTLVADRVTIPQADGGPQFKVGSENRDSLCYNRNSSSHLYQTLSMLPRVSNVCKLIGDQCTTSPIMSASPPPK